MKTPLLLLHGAIGASGQLQAIADNLSADYDVQHWVLNFIGMNPLPQKKLLC